MLKNKDEAHKSLIGILTQQIPPLRIRKNSDDVFEVCGTKEAMQGKKKVDGFYFASVIPKPKDVRFYFFPIYTHPEHFTELSDSLRKMLKGKSCFHLKHLDNSLLDEIKNMVKTGIAVYSKDQLI
ncbi:hypothetical protein ACJD0Z_01790 [Flavobacteriaceae bacterium M23B6Z8]